jgi:hypothetical protein
MPGRKLVGSPFAGPAAPATTESTSNRIWCFGFRRVLAARVDDGSLTIPRRVERGIKGYLNGGAIGSEDLQRPPRAATNRIDIPDQPFVLLLA